MYHPTPECLTWIHDTQTVTEPCPGVDIYISGRVLWLIVGQCEPHCALDTREYRAGTDKKTARNSGTCAFVVLQASRPQAALQDSQNLKSRQLIGYKLRFSSDSAQFSVTSCCNRQATVCRPRGFLSRRMEAMTSHPGHQVS